MRASGRVQAVLGNHETFDGLAIHDMRLDDLIDIGGGDAPVPNRIWINYDGGPVLTLIEAARHIGPHSLPETAQGEFLFELELQLGLGVRITTSARVARVALIATDEKMFLKLGHKSQFTGFSVEQKQWDDSVGLLN